MTIYDDGPFPERNGIRLPRSDVSQFVTKIASIAPVPSGEIKSSGPDTRVNNTRALNLGSVKAQKVPNDDDRR